MYKYLLLCLLLLPCSRVNAQIFPAEGRALHYRVIGFSFPKHAGVKKYTLQIAKGNDSTQAGFEAHILLSAESKENKVIAEVPEFGCGYTWRVIDSTSHGKAPLHHFSTLFFPQLDTSKNHLRIIKNEGKYNAAMVFVDATRCLYNTDGKPVWFLPEVKGFTDLTLQVRDMKTTSQGTITFLIGEKAYEVNYDGEILWYMPKSKRTSGFEGEHFHHELTRLKNGHYMVLGNEFVWFKLPTPGHDSVPVIPRGEMEPDPKHTIYGSAQFGTVLEYDKNGEVVWSWHAWKHYNIRELFFRKNPAMPINLDMHQNAFFFNEQAKQLYVSFKNTSQVVKISYPKGDILNTYGKAISSKGTGDGADFFCGQHSCKYGATGELYVFNNNICNSDSLPVLIALKEPVTKDEHVKKVWEFYCPVEESQKGEQKKFDKSHFGNVLELPGGDIFASACGPFGNVFIVNRKKEVLWNAVSEQWNGAEKKWSVLPTYRASIITSRKDFEHLIWSAQ